MARQPKVSGQRSGPSHLELLGVLSVDTVLFTGRRRRPEVEREAEDGLLCSFICRGEEGWGRSRQRCPPAVSSD